MNQWLSETTHLQKIALRFERAGLEFFPFERVPTIKLGFLSLPTNGRIIAAVTRGRREFRRDGEEEHG